MWKRPCVIPKGVKWHVLLWSDNGNLVLEKRIVSAQHLLVLLDYTKLRHSPCTCLHTYIYIYWRSPRCIVANMLDWDIIVIEFELLSRYYAHLRTNTHEKGMPPLFPQLWFRYHYCSSARVDLASNNPRTLIRFNETNIYIYIYIYITHQHVRPNQLFIN